jgi:hypothetical protein
MNRRSFSQGAACLLPMSWLAKNLRASEVETRKPKTETAFTKQNGILDVRGILAMYDLPGRPPNPVWHIYQDFFSFDARKDHRYDGDFWDKERWEKYLTLWSQEGYNTIWWYGRNELMTGDHLFVRFSEFPEAREISAELSEKCIQQVKWLFRCAKGLGLRNIIYGDFLHYTRAFEKAHGLDKPMPKSEAVYSVYRDELSLPCGVRNEITIRYTTSLIYEICTLYEDLDGFYAPMGECVPGERSTFYAEAVIPGLKRSGRNLPFMVMGWQTPLDDFSRNIAPREVYENTWLGWHAYNAEQVTDPKPYPNLVGWAEALGLPTVSTFYPSNHMWFPFNSPKFGYEMAFEMKRIPNFRGFMYWEFSGRKLSPLFRKALARYAKSDEPYSDEPWIDLLQEQFGDREAAQHLLNAYNISGRIIPEKSALVWDPVGFPRGELHLPYALMTGDAFQWSWAVSPVRTNPLQPIWHYAAWAAKHPNIFKDQNGSDWRTVHGSPLDFHQAVLWRTEGGSSYDVIPPVHMAKIRSMGEDCFAEAKQGLARATKNREEALHAVKFMQGYMLLSAYFERKVGAATAGLIYSNSRLEPDRHQAETLADEALAKYEEAANFLHHELDPIIQSLYQVPLHEMRGAYVPTQFNFDSAGSGLLEIPALLEAEKQERAEFANLFYEGKGRFTDNFVG